MKEEDNSELCFYVPYIGLCKAWMKLNCSNTQQNEFDKYILVSSDDVKLHEDLLEIINQAIAP
jgi:hypothetical protein